MRRCEAQAMSPEPIRRLADVPPETRVRLASGRAGTVRAVNFTRALVELDDGEDRHRELAPSCEVRVLASSGDGNGPGKALARAAMRNTGSERLESPPRPRYASEATPARARAIACTVCGGPMNPRRPWGAYCSGACRQRAYRVRARQVTLGH